MAKPQYSGPWQRLRKQILNRDQYLCQIQAPRCTTHATHVDHIQPVTDGGAWWDPNNLRAACKNCNLGRNTQNPNDRWRKAKTHITLVLGPPHYDKRPHINAKPGDLIIDYDELASALNLEGNVNTRGIVQATRRAAIRALQRGQVDVARAFIISSNPRGDEFLPYHTLQIVDPGEQQVLNLLRQQRSTSDQRDRVRAWYVGRGSRYSTAPVSTSSRNW